MSQRKLVSESELERRIRGTIKAARLLIRLPKTEPLSAETSRLIGLISQRLDRIDKKVRRRRGRGLSLDERQAIGRELARMIGDLVKSLIFCNQLRQAEFWISVSP